MSSSYTSPEYTHCISDARFRYNVYEPEADTFLFLEALDKDADLLLQLSPRRCIEIGCGSGTVITHLRCLLMPPPSASSSTVTQSENDAATSLSEVAAMTAVGGPAFYAVDVNPLALEATGITWTETLRKYFMKSVLESHFQKVFQSTVPTTLALPVTVTETTSDTAAQIVISSGALDTTEASSRACSASGPNSGPCKPAPASSTYCLRRFQGDLFDPVHRAGSSLSEVQPNFDIIFFNPPYVPTSLEELEDAVAKKDVITAAWCGGPRGRVVLDRFLRQLPAVMSRGGATYVVLIKENEVADVIAYAEEQFRAHLGKMGEVEPVKDGASVLETAEVAARYTGEHLSVYRFRYAARYRSGCA